MLSLPKYGWTEFSIGNVKYSLSFLLSDIPIDWLESAIYGLKNLSPTMFYGWCEPEYVFCNVTKNFCYIICADEEQIFETHSIKITMLDFCKKLHVDISSDVNAWSNWSCDDDKTFQKNQKRKIQSLLDELAALIKERSQEKGLW